MNETLDTPRRSSSRLCSFCEGARCMKPSHSSHSSSAGGARAAASTADVGVVDEGPRSRPAMGSCAHAWHDHFAVVLPSWWFSHSFHRLEPSVVTNGEGVESAESWRCGAAATSNKSTQCTFFTSQTPDPITRAGSSSFRLCSRSITHSQQYRKHDKNRRGKARTANGDGRESTRNLSAQE